MDSIPIELSSLKYDIYETEDKFTVVFYINSIRSDSFKNSLTEHSITIEFSTSDPKFLGTHGGDSDTVFVMSSPLKGTIVPTSCSHVVKKMKVEIRMRKVESKKWGSLAPNHANSMQVVPATWKNLGDESNTVSKQNKPTCKVTPIRKVEKVVDSGFTGLENIGNTCFMNSVLQCLNNTKELRDYFLGSQFFTDINRTNPLGMKGQLAESFSKLISDMWDGKQASIAPHRLKGLLAKKAPQFCGYAQHDAHELLAFLLDGLHEDLNRVTNPPQTGTIESDGKEDVAVAQESWDTYKLRNDSVIVDLFQGQFRSKLICPTCRKVSVTFDPYLFLQLAIPKKQVMYTVNFFWKSPMRKPTKIEMFLPMDSKAGILMEELSNRTGVRKESIRLWELTSSRWKRAYHSSLTLAPPTTLYAYEVDGTVEVSVIQRLSTPCAPDTCTSCSKKGANLKRCTKCFKVAYCDQRCQRDDWNRHKAHCSLKNEITGIPFILSFTSHHVPYSAVATAMDRLARSSVDAFRAPVDHTKASDTGSEDYEENLEYMFNIKPISLSGQDLQDQEGYYDELGDTIIDLSKVLCLAMDWKNNKKLPHYVLVKGKVLETELDPNNESSPRDITLSQCFDLLTQTEILSPQESWYCPNCKKHCEASKQLHLWKLPTVLIVQLKRFSFKNILWKDKLDTYVSFPVRDLDVSPFMCGRAPEIEHKTVYDLYAVVNHYGDILGGHYTAAARTVHMSNTRCSEIDWRLFDDERVRSIEESNVVSRHAYLLFYRRRGVPFSQHSNL